MGKLDQTQPSAPGQLRGLRPGAAWRRPRACSEQTTIEVVLNTGPELFKAGECPDAALYCGWYSLAKYVDAFDWQRGAVAYHLASSEAATLRDPGSQVWCKKMIEDGVAATIGPVYEPYLMAFPRPEQFFGLLLEGRPHAGGVLLPHAAVQQLDDDADRRPAVPAVQECEGDARGSGGSGAPGAAAPATAPGP